LWRGGLGGIERGKGEKQGGEEGRRESRSAHEREDLLPGGRKVDANDAVIVRGRRTGRQAWSNSKQGY
jgi:hypothetical protein